ncbi:hypothetical protein U9M48_006790 [Paspalum notatum var. saurae]|uniref:Uncharacterized protein n=1 Tax=Paspalum notatum var. saurae TaxID=547442 RepID=A0AAQ3SKT8_PASNO
MRHQHRGLNASASGVMVYSSMMQPSGKTEILLTPNDTSPVGPLINTGEIYQIVPLGSKTVTRDVVAMEDLASSFKNPPPDWAEDPCLPQQHSWTGVECSKEPPVRVLSVDLKNHGLTGTLPDSIGNLTGVQTIYLSGNKLSGSIPDMSSMHTLTALRLGGNQFSGTINPSMEKLVNLKELYLNNNNLTGKIPDGLKNKVGLDLRTEGNKFE